MALTQEQFDVLGKPFPQSVIKSFTGKGGKEMRYIDVEVLEDRVRQVDINFGKDVTPGAKSVAVHYTIHGVRRGDLFDNDDESNKYGAPQVNAFARACRRALKAFGVGADLWEEDGAATQPTPIRQAAQPQINRPTEVVERGGPSVKQLEWLTGDKFGVPQQIAQQLSGGRGGSASAMIDALKRYVDEDDYKARRMDYIKKALRDVGAEVKGLDKVKVAVPAYEDDEDED
jgi:hypothetical protein